MIETRHCPRRLAVVFRQAEPHQQSSAPQQDRDGQRDGGDLPAVGDGVALDDAVFGPLVQIRAPVPQRDDVDLLRALDGARTEDPRSDLRAAFVAKVEREEDGSR